MECISYATAILYHLKKQLMISIHFSDK